MMYLSDKKQADAIDAFNNTLIFGQYFKHY